MLRLYMNPSSLLQKWSLGELAKPSQGFLGLSGSSVLESRSFDLHLPILYAQ